MESARAEGPPMLSLPSPKSPQSPKSPKAKSPKARPPPLNIVEEALEVLGAGQSPETVEATWKRLNPTRDAMSAHDLHRVLIDHGLGSKLQSGDLSRVFKAFDLDKNKKISKAAFCRTLVGRPILA